MNLFGFDNSEVFKLLNLIALPPWILILVAPRTKFTKVAVLTTCITVTLAFILFFLMELTSTSTIQNYNQILSMFNVSTFSNLSKNLLNLNYENIKKIFFSEIGFLAMWSHYIIIDMSLGYSIAIDAYTSNVPFLLKTPCLILTLLLAPLGYLSYFFIKNLNYLISNEVKYEKIE